MGDWRFELGWLSHRPSRIAHLFFLIALSTASGQQSLQRDRFLFQFSPQDRPLALSLAANAIANDTFPGLPRPTQRVTIAIAADRRNFRELVGSTAPEWGSAVAFPDSRRVVLQGRSAGADAGFPAAVLRHELAHLALHESLGDLPPRWFDEGYASLAAGEWGREEVLTTNVALALRGMPTLAELEESFEGGEVTAQSAYALAYRAVFDLSRLGGEHGLSLLFGYWRNAKSLDAALRRAHGVTLATFETDWRRRTRSQYGGLALASNLALAGLLLLVILFPLYIARRRRDRLRLTKMREADAAAEAAQQSAIDDLLGGS